MTLLCIGSVWGYDVRTYSDISVVNLNNWEQLVGETQLNFLIYNNTDGQILANVPVSVKFGDWNNYTILNATTDAYGVVKFNINLSDHSNNNLQFTKINDVSIPEWGIDFWFEVRSRYWSIFHEDRVIAENGTINISVPMAKAPYVEPYNGDIDIWFFKYNPDWKLYKIVNYTTTNGMIDIYESNITNITTIGINGWNSSTCWGCDALFDVYPNESYIPCIARFVPDFVEVQRGATVPMLLMSTDANGRPVENKTFTVEVRYDYSWDNISTFNITTNEYGIAEFNITANANDYISIEAYDEKNGASYNEHCSDASIHIIKSTSTSTSSTTMEYPTLELSFNNHDIKPNEETTITIRFKNGTTPISNAKVLLYDNNGYLGEVTTNINGDATFTYKKSKEGSYYVLAITNYNGKPYTGKDDLRVLTDYDVKNRFLKGGAVICESKAIRKVAQSIIIDPNKQGWVLVDDEFHSPKYERGFHSARCLEYIYPSEVRKYLKDHKVAPAN